VRQRLVVPAELDQDVADILLDVRQGGALAELAEDREGRPVRRQRIGQAAHRTVDGPEVVRLLGGLQLAPTREEVRAAQPGQRRCLVVPPQVPQRRDVADLGPGDLQRSPEPHEPLLDRLVR